jgi:hypothetical protein
MPSVVMPTTEKPRIKPEQDRLEGEAPAAVLGGHGDAAQGTGHFGPRAMTTTLVASYRQRWAAQGA